MDRLEQLKKIDQKLERLHQRLGSIWADLCGCARQMKRLGEFRNGEPCRELAEMLDEAAAKCSTVFDMLEEIRNAIREILASGGRTDPASAQKIDALIEEAEMLLEEEAEEDSEEMEECPEAEDSGEMQESLEEADATDETDATEVSDLIEEDDITDDPLAGNAGSASTESSSTSGSAPTPGFCRCCGGELTPGLRFCPRCGASTRDYMETGWEAAYGKTPASAPSAPHNHSTGTRRCPVCGCSVEAGQVFCLMCGSPVNEASAPQSYGSPHAAPSSGHGNTASHSPYGAASPDPKYPQVPAPAPMAKKRGGGLVGRIAGGIAGGIAGVFDREKPEKKKENGRRPDREKRARTDDTRKIAPPPAVTRVEFSAIAPRTLVKGDYSILHIMMYEKAFREEVDRVIAEAGVPVGETRSGGMNVAMESRVRIHLDSPDVEIRDAEETRVWTGEYLDFSFAVAMPKDFAGHQVLFTASVYINDLIATKLRFTAQCVSAYEQKIAVAREDILTAFVSYASQDRSRVAAIIQGMNKARPDMDIFFDVESLRSGMDWEEALHGEIEKRDIFFLCWSLNARNSEWVQREWRYALTQKGIECIEPIPLDPPRDCPPPEELKKKHFNDRMLFVIKASE